jgi:hypothetical protein
MARESAITTSITNAIKRRCRDAFVMKIHGGPCQKAGVPDLLVLWRGTAFFLEVKQPGGLATKLQKHRIREIVAAGGVAGVVYNADDALTMMGVNG